MCDNHNVNVDNLSKLVQLIVPHEYGPDPHLENGKPLLGVYLISRDEAPETWEKEGTVATITDMGKLATQAGVENAGLLGRYIVRLLEDIPYHAAGVVLAHEIGHLVSILEHNDRSERSAEEWAISRIIGLDIAVDEKVKFLSYSENL